MLQLIFLALAIVGLVGTVDHISSDDVSVPGLLRGRVALVLFTVGVLGLGWLAYVAVTG